MNELTDLELCRRIADIENIHYMETRYTENNFLALVSENDFTGTPPEMIGKYDPLTDDALCFQLMVKYKIDINFDEDNNICTAWYAEYKSVQNINMNKAILLAIIEVHKE